MATVTLTGMAPLRQRLNALGRAAAVAQATTVAVGSPLGYAGGVESGTRPHVIRARNARFLRFTIGNRLVFRRSVRHPGMRAQPYLIPAYWDQRGSVAGAVADGVRVAALTGRPTEARQGMVDGGLYVLDEARNRVPVRRGDLRASLGVYVNGRRVNA